MSFAGKSHSEETKRMIAESVHVNRKGHFPPKKTLVCETCSQEYAPKAGNQRWCGICCPSDLARQRLVLYGLSQPQYDELLKKQEGKCALCDKEPSVVDHDHLTKVVRGLLCYACNIALGRVDVSGWVQRALAYVTQKVKTKDGVVV